MRIGHTCRSSVALALAFVTLLPTSAYGQDSKPQPSDPKSEVEAVKAENAALKEQIRKIEEQQKILEEMLKDLKQQLEKPAVAGKETPSAQSPAETQAAQVPAAAPQAAEAAQAPQPAEERAAQPESNRQQVQTPFFDKLSPEHFQDGFILVQTKESSKLPFRLKLNNVTQFRFLNTQLKSDNFTDHLGVQRPVNERNDFSVNRSMFTFSGLIFNPKLKYSLVIWTSNTLAAVVFGGYVGWEFNKALQVNAGYWTIPGTRTLSFTFPYFVQPDRSMADNFFRPGFTQGVWAMGEPVPGLWYHVFLGNGLNTLTIPTSKIDTNLLFSGTVSYEPFGNFGPPGKARNMYDDYYISEKPIVRIGTSFTASREDRFTNLDQSNPENTAMHNSDGVLTFATGAFAPGVTVDEATYRMWAIDYGFKWRGLSANGQYYFRWVYDFTADGPIPLDRMVDQGTELAVGHFVIPKKLELYGRSSAVFGEFRSPWEVGAGFKWHFVPDHRMWLTGEALRVHNSAFGGMIYPYNAGMDGWAFVGQTLFQF